MSDSVHHTPPPRDIPRGDVTILPPGVHIDPSVTSEEYLHFVRHALRRCMAEAVEDAIDESDQWLRERFAVPGDCSSEDEADA